MKLLSYEIVDFNSDRYWQKITHRDYTWQDLAKNIYSKRRHIASSTTSVVTSVACAHLTGGWSLVATAYAVRNISVEKQKLALLEEAWARRGVSPLEKRSIKDAIIPVVLCGALGIFTFNIDLGLSEAACAAAYAEQIGVEGLYINGHLVGAGYTVLEKAMSMASSRWNDSVAVSSFITSATSCSAEQASRSVNMNSCEEEDGDKIFTSYFITTTLDADNLPHFLCIVGVYRLSVGLRRLGGWTLKDGVDFNNGASGWYLHSFPSSFPPHSITLAIFRVYIPPR